MTQPNLRLVEGTSVDKTKALDAALSQIERAFGKGSIMRLGKNQKAVEIETVPTGSLGLDIALGVGGLPRGRVIEIYGPESSGKTTLTLHVIAEAQKKGGVCAFVDAEHALDPIYARKLGVKLDDLLISQPDTGEQALEITDTLVRSGAIDVLVIDSVAALTPRAEIEGEMGDSQPGLQARLMSQALRKLPGSISRSRAMIWRSICPWSSFGPRAISFIPATRSRRCSRTTKSIPCSLNALIGSGAPELIRLVAVSFRSFPVMSGFCSEPESANSRSIILRVRMNQV